MTTTAFPDDGDFGVSSEELRRAVQSIGEATRRATGSWEGTFQVPVPSLPSDTLGQLAEVIQGVNRQLAPSLEAMAEVSAQVSRQLAPGLEAMAEVSAQVSRQLAPSLRAATDVLAQFQHKTRIPIGQLDLSALAAVGRAISEDTDLAREIDQAGDSNEDLTAVADLVVAAVPPEGAGEISREDVRRGVFAAVTVAWFAMAVMVAVGAPDPSLVNWLWNLASRTMEGVAIAAWASGKILPAVPTEGDRPSE